METNRSDCSSYSWGTGAASARSDRADEQLEEHFGDGRHPGRGRGKGNAHGPDIEDGDDTEGYMLTISVVDAETSEPIEGAIVQGFGDRDAYGGDKLFAVTTGPDGTGTTGAQPGEYLTDVDADGCGTSILPSTATRRCRSSSNPSDLRGRPSTTGVPLARSNARLIQSRVS